MAHSAASYRSRSYGDTLGQPRKSVDRSRRVVLLAAVLLSFALGQCSTAIAIADPPGIPSQLEVASSYADTERTNNCANCIPSPWCGSPGVQFVGASTNYNGNPNDKGNCAGGDWDTGAVLVTNTGAASVTLTGLTVALPLPSSGSPGSPTCKAEARPITFDIWFGQQYYYGNKSDPAYFGGPITIPPGGQAIFAGTTSDGTYKCPSGNYPSGPTDGTYDFDTSDAYFLDGCAPTTDTASAPPGHIFGDWLRGDYVRRQRPRHRHGRDRHGELRPDLDEPRVAERGARMEDG